jgi:membrane fusion protein, macrolide-specific efflux system
VKAVKPFWLAAFVAFFTLASLAIAAWLAVHGKANKPASAPVSVADIEESVLATGKLDASLLINVGVQASGQIRKLYVAVGDTVKAGELIAEIDATQQLNSVRNAEAAFDILHADYAQQIAALKRDQAAMARQQKLLSLGVSTKADFELAESTLATTRAQMRATEARMVQSKLSLATERAKLGYTKITAPIDGVVVAILAKEGQTVNALQSAPTIVKVAKLDVMLISVGISEADVQRVRPGMKAYFTTLGEPEKRHYGVLRSIDPAPDSLQSEGNIGGVSTQRAPAAVYYNALLEIPNTKGDLRIAMTAQVHVLLATARHAKIVPSSALGPEVRHGWHSVLVEERGRTHVREVHIGINNSVEAQVLDGLDVGERVLVSGDGRSEAGV